MRFVQNFPLLWNFCRVIWKVACNKYLQVTTPRKVLQVGWITFRDSTDTSFMCILMPGLLQLQDDDGEEYSIPLLQDFIRFSPIPDGLLLTVSYLQVH